VARELEALKRSATQIEDLKTKLETARSRELELSIAHREAQRERDDWKAAERHWHTELHAERMRREEAETAAASLRRRLDEVQAVLGR